MFETFGVDPGKFFLQLAIGLVPLGLAVLATVQVVRNRTGESRWLWLAGIWLTIPIVAPIIALLMVRPWRRIAQSL